MSAATVAGMRIDRGATVRLAIGVLLIAAMVAGPSVYGRLTAGGRVDPALERVAGPVNVTVRMAFQPESYQQATLSQYGVFGGIRGHSVVLFNVSPQALAQIERLYWIDEIVPFRRT